ncbi:hypothetical protein CK934_16740 [Chitinophaga sp. MD30]|nr:hypothetical protein CK934_16740 [Chitinophaga sp. MD30]
MRWMNKDINEKLHKSPFVNCKTAKPILPVEGDDVMSVRATHGRISFKQRLSKDYHRRVESENEIIFEDKSYEVC